MSTRSVKERDVAGMTAFEVSLQYLLLRQDRSYHFIQFLTAVGSLIFFSGLFLVLWLSLVEPVLPMLPLAFAQWLAEQRSSLVTLVVLALIALLLLRASKKKFIIEPGEEMVERLNREVLEPCLGLTFDISSGKLFTDGRIDNMREPDSFYQLRYCLDSHSSN
ncbi:hypothetical protein STCU_01795 [Strigomonas culicis]|uniref:Uncharacterized protein n=1 Tax=Strigomonas culicis TaxID=28005 RepID=S9W499_9TRYP|nr:hypothetical protein STCU_04206 [Strigomonas culicis]EPY32971.1 hypothetical protein STCU_02553 [Strigomonas culicis]EPY34176.1 hypothetical protein STCU_01795 [Strigomonas culicis]|eukprot:EPY30159.1 hypothetical protein STCU_04206 [Strigomonas culicis]